MQIGLLWFFWRQHIILKKLPTILNILAATINNFDCISCWVGERRWKRGCRVGQTVNYNLDFF